MSPISHGAGISEGSYRDWYNRSDGEESYRDWYICQHNYSPESDESSPRSVAPDNEDVPRSHDGPSEYSPISDNEYPYVQNNYPYVQRQTSDSDDDERVTEEQYYQAITHIAETHELFQTQCVHSASDDSEEEEELMHVPSPRDVRAARRSTLRRAFHPTLFFLMTMIIPGDATDDAFVAPSQSRRRLQRLRLTVQLSTCSTSVGFSSLGSMCSTDCALAS